MHLSTLVALCGILTTTIAAPESEVNGKPSNRPAAAPVYNTPAAYPGGNGYVRGHGNTTPDDDDVLNDLSFYMCCQSSPTSSGIDNYYPPYACIYGPASGACPQGVTSSFPYAWLCTYQTGATAGAAGNFDCVYESGTVTSGLLSPVLNAVDQLLEDVGL